MSNSLTNTLVPSWPDNTDNIISYYILYELLQNETILQRKSGVLHGSHHHHNNIHYSNTVLTMDTYIYNMVIMPHILLWQSQFHYFPQYCVSLWHLFCFSDGFPPDCNFKCGLMDLCERHNTLGYFMHHLMPFMQIQQYCWSFSAHCAVFTQQTKQGREIPTALYRPFCQQPFSKQTPQRVWRAGKWMLCCCAVWCHQYCSIYSMTWVHTGF